MFKFLIFLSLFVPFTLQAVERTPVRISLSGSNLNLRKLDKNNSLTPTGQTLSNAVIELSVPTSLVNPEISKIDPLELIDTWKRAYPDDFKQQAGIAFQPIKILSSASTTPSDETVYAGLEFQLKRPGTKVKVLDENTKINTDTSCTWIEEQIPNHAPIHQLGSTEGEACTLCDLFLKPEAFSEIRGLVTKVRESYTLPAACVENSMRHGRPIVQSRFQRCNDENSNQKSRRPTCVTPELMKYNQKIMISVAMCFGLSPKLLFPMVHHESRFFSNIQASGGDTGFTQLTGPFVKEMVRLYGEDINSFEKLSGTTNPSCADIKQEYENNLPMIHAKKSQRCSWMNPITNLVLASAHFRYIYTSQNTVIDEFANEAFSEETKSAILSMVATHSHHMPMSKIRLRQFLNSPAFKKMHNTYVSRGEKIPLDVFVNIYKTQVRGKAGTYFANVLKDYRRLSENQAGCGW